MKQILLMIFFSVLLKTSFGQGFALNTTAASANGSAILDISSDTKGMLIPRVYLSAKNSATPINNPANSLIVYNMVTSGSGDNAISPGYYYWDGNYGVWNRLLSDNNDAWKIKGNSNTNPTVQYLGTTDLTSLKIKTNGLPAMYFDYSSNFVGIGNENPGDNLVISLNSRAVFPSPANFAGIQIKTINNTGTANNTGLHLGLSGYNNYADAHVMNFQTGDLLLGTNGYDMIYLKSGTDFVGINDNSARDNLTIRLDPAAVKPTPDNYSGILINGPNGQGYGNDHGLHIGLDNYGYSTARILNSEAGDLWLGTNRVDMMYLKTGSRFVGINTHNPFHALTVVTGTAGIYSSPYDGLNIVTPNNIVNESSGLVVGSDQSAYQNKGIWNYDNGKIAFATSNQERLTLAATGELGINTLSPQAKLHLVDGSALFSMAGVATSSSAAPISGWGRRMMWYVDKAAFRAGYIDGSQWDASFSGNYSFAGGYNTQASGIASVALGSNVYAKADGGVTIGMYNDLSDPSVTGTLAATDRMFQIGNGTSLPGSSNAMTVLRSGNIGLENNTTPRFALTFGNTTGDKVVLTDDGNAPGNNYGIGLQAGLLQIHSYNSGTDIVFGYGSSTSFTENVRFRGTGNVGIGTNNPTQKLHVIGNILATGTITPSDIRYKQNIKLIGSPLQKLGAIRGVTYNYKVNDFPQLGFNANTQIGFIAQEVEKVLPELVVTDDQGYKAVDYSKMTPVLVEAIKNQQTQIDEQKTKIDALENELRAIKKHLLNK